jgi:hypothetical protein
MKKLIIVSAFALVSFTCNAQANNPDPLKQKYRIETIYKDGVKVGYEAYYYSGTKRKGQWVGMSIHPFNTEEEALARIEQERERTRKFYNIEWVLVEDDKVKLVVNKQ